MRGFRSTIIFFATVVLIVAYTFYEYRNAEKDAAQERGESSAFNLKREDVNAIKLFLKGVEIELTRSSDQSWQMLKPVEDLAEGPIVEGLLYTLFSQKLRSFQSEDESKNIEWPIYGLENASIWVELSGNGQKERLGISDTTAYDGSFYVRRGDQLLLGDATLNQLSARTPASFRSRKLWREADGFKIQSVDLVLAQGSFKRSFRVTKTGETWNIDPKPAFPVDQEKIGAWVDRLLDVMPSDFVKETIEEGDKKQFALLNPSLQATVSFEGSKGGVASWTLTVGQDKGEDVYLWSSTRSTLYKTASSGLTQLRVPQEAFRDGKQAFRFDIEKAHEVEVRGSKWTHTFVKQDSKWMLKDGAEAKELDEDKLVQLITNIRSLDAQEFPEKVQPVNLKPRILIRDGQGKELFTLSWGEEYSPVQPWNAGFKYLPVRTNLERQLMGLPKDKVERLIDDGIVKDKKLDTKAKATKPESQ